MLGTDSAIGSWLNVPNNESLLPGAYLLPSLPSHSSFHKRCSFGDFQSWHTTSKTNHLYNQSSERLLNISLRW